jgi:hypothetical protein
MEIQSICNKCQGPVFLNRVVDSLGNTVLTLNCWNGHYNWIEFKNIEEEMAKKPKDDLILYLGFMDAD